MGLYQFLIYVALISKTNVGASPRVRLQKEAAGKGAWVLAEIEKTVVNGGPRLEFPDREMDRTADVCEQSEQFPVTMLAVSNIGVV